MSDDSRLFLEKGIRHGIIQVTPAGGAAKPADNAGDDADGKREKAPEEERPAA
jgi:hypothetical protein